MNRLSSPAYLQAMATVPGVLAHGPTPEQLTAAEMHLAAPHTTTQRSLFQPQHAHLGVAPQGQPDPAGCVPALSRMPE
jgi:hypothetical protein